MSTAAPIVYIVDDDPAVRDSLSILMETVGLTSRVYESAGDFLNAYDSTQHACLVADIRMPGMSGLDLQEALNERRARLPLIFITGHGDVPMAVDAMKAGAIDFIQKPFRDQELLDRIQQALDRDRQRLEESARAVAIRSLMDTLTPRERQVMDRVVVGQANKVIALDLGVSQRTVELHRARVMKKMRVRSLAQLVRAAEIAEDA